MSEFKRWTDEGAPEAIDRLLKAAASEEPSLASLTNTLTRVGVAAGVTSGAAVSGAAGQSALASGTAATKLSGLAIAASFAKWVVLGSAVGGLGVAAYTATNDEPASVPAPTVAAPQAPAASVAAAAPRHPSTPSAKLVPSAEPARSFAPRASSTPRPMRSPPDTPTSTAALARDAVAGAIPAETLAAEIAGIDRARSLLGAGRYSAAIAALDDYERRFPRHHFAPEVLYLRMQAASGAGRSDEARALARSLLARYPTSPQSEKAKRLLDRKIE